MRSFLPFERRNWTPEFTVLMSSDAQTHKIWNGPTYEKQLPGDLAVAKQHMTESISMSNSCGNRALATLVGMIANGLSDTSVSAAQRLESAVQNLQIMIDTGVEDDEVSMQNVAESLGLEEFEQLQSAGAHLSVTDIAKWGERLVESLGKDRRNNK